MRTVADLRPGDEIAGYMLVEELDLSGNSHPGWGVLREGERPLRFWRMKDGLQCRFVMNRADPISLVVEMLDYGKVRRPLQPIALERQ